MHAASRVCRRLGCSRRWGGRRMQRPCPRRPGRCGRDARDSDISWQHAKVGRCRWAFNSRGFWPPQPPPGGDSCWGPCGQCLMLTHAGKVVKYQAALMGGGVDVGGRWLVNCGLLRAGRAPPGKRVMGRRKTAGGQRGAQKLPPGHQPPATNHQPRLPLSTGKLWTLRTASATMVPGKGRGSNAQLFRGESSDGWSKKSQGFYAR